MAAGALIWGPGRRHGGRARFWPTAVTAAVVALAAFAAARLVAA